MVLLEHYSFKELLVHLEKTAHFYSEHGKINQLDKDQLVNERNKKILKIYLILRS